MFWRWNSDLAYMETERGCHLSQGDALDQALFALTYWGDYAGTIYSRFHHDLLLDLAPNVVTSVKAAHGQGLMVRRGGFGFPSTELRTVISFVVEMSDRDAYPIWDENSFYDWEWKLKEAELATGWTGKRLREDWERALEARTDWKGTLIPEQGSDEFWELYSELTEDGDVDEYWESADSLIISGLADADAIVEKLLNKYALSMTRPGPEQPTLI